MNSFIDDCGVSVKQIYEGYGVQIGIERGTNRVLYRYDANEDMTFCFDLFCMIGEPWQGSFNALIKEYGLNILLYDYEYNYYEVLITGVAERPHERNQRQAAPAGDRQEAGL